MGILFLIYGAFLCRKFNKRMRIIPKKSFRILDFLIYAFILGYTYYLYNLIQIFLYPGNTNTIVSNETISSVIFFLGALFVVLIINTNCSLIQKLNEKSDYLKKINENLNKEIEELRKNNQKCLVKNEETEKALREINQIKQGIQEHLDKN